MQEKDLNFILDNQHLKRGILIADKAKQTLLIIGSSDTQGAEIAERFDFVSFWQPCPCGYYNHSEKECICTSAQIAKYLSKKPKTDLEVEIRQPRFETLIKKTDLKDKDSIAILEKYYKAGKIGYNSVLSAIKTAKAIAELNNFSKIRLQDMTEALSYCIKTD